MNDANERNGGVEERRDGSPISLSVIEQLSSSLAGAFAPFFRDKEPWHELSRAIRDYLGVEHEFHTESMEYQSIEMPTARRGLSRWCNLVPGKPDTSGVVAEIQSIKGVERYRPTFGELNVGDEERERCLIKGVLFLTVGEERAVVTVAQHYQRAQEPLLIEFHLRPGEGLSILESFKAALVQYDATRGRRVLSDGTGLGFLTPTGVTWDDVILPRILIEEVRKNSTLFLKARANGRGAALPSSRSILLYGAPGTGKTMIGKALASELVGTTFLWITPGGFGEVGDPGFFFRWARERAPAVLFFEDLDLVVGVRDSNHDGTLGEVLAQLDGFVSNEGLVVIATTNDPEAIDKALRRPGRFDRQIEVPLPAEEERRRMLDQFLTGMTVADRDLLTTAGASLTRGYSGAHLRELVDSVMLNRLVLDEDAGAIELDEFETAVGILQGTRKDLGFASARGQGEHLL